MCVLRFCFRPLVLKLSRGLAVHVANTGQLEERKMSLKGTWAAWSDMPELGHTYVATLSPPTHARRARGRAGGLYNTRA